MFYILKTNIYILFAIQNCGTERIEMKDLSVHSLPRTRVVSSYHRSFGTKVNINIMSNLFLNKLGLRGTGKK